MTLYASSHMIDISSEHDNKQTTKMGYFSCFDLISPGCDLEVILPWPWYNSPMKLNTYQCDHVYLAWVSTYLFLYHPKGQGYHTSMTSGDLVHAYKLCRPPKVTWYIVMFQKMWSTQIPRGRGYSWAHARYNSLNLHTLATSIQKHIICCAVHSRR